MKTYFFKRFVVTVFLCIIWETKIVMAIDLATDTVANFQAVATSLITRHSWDEAELTHAELQSFNQLTVLANSIMHEPAYVDTIVPLFTLYKDQDAYPRQALFYSLINGRKYTVSDMPFLKSMFTASINLPSEKHLPRDRNWITPSSFRTDIAVLILGITGRGGMIGTSEFGLLDTDPLGWIAKYAP